VAYFKDNPQAFDVGGNFVKQKPDGGFYGVPDGRTPVQTNVGSSFFGFSQDQVNLAAAAVIGGVAIAGIAGAGAVGAGSALHAAGEAPVYASTATSTITGAGSAAGAIAQVAQAARALGGSSPAMPARTPSTGSTLVFGAVPALGAKGNDGGAAAASSPPWTWIAIAIAIASPALNHHG
jgi:hypothetical protein